MSGCRERVTTRQGRSLTKYSAIDVYHTYLSLAALSLGAVKDRALDLRRLDPAWNVPVALAASMRTHLWRDST